MLHGQSLHHVGLGLIEGARKHRNVSTNAKPVNCRADLSSAGGNASSTNRKSSACRTGEGDVHVELFRRVFQAKLFIPLRNLGLAHNLDRAIDQSLLRGKRQQFFRRANGDG